MKSMLIIDGHAEIHRAYHARMPDLTSLDGEPTKATYVFCRSLFRLLRAMHPDFVAFAVDSPREKLWRREWYGEYKANRAKTEDDRKRSELPVQIKRCKQIVSLLGIPVVEAERWEADDVIATLVDAVEGTDVEVTIVGRDKDLLQLLGQGVKMYDVLNDEEFVAERVPTMLGIKANQVIDYLSLVGDTSDNIPGVKGIGPKIAQRILNNHGSVAAFKASGGDGESANVKKLIDAALEDGSFDLWTKLVTLNKDAPIELDADALQFEGIKTSKVKPVFRELGFRRWSKWYD